MRIAAALLAALALAGCAESTAEAPTATAPRLHHGRGLTVELPAGWQAAPRSLTPDLTDPREALSVGTFPLRYRRTGCAHMPSSALADEGPRDAFITLQERGRGARPAAFPARPARFGPPPGGRVGLIECVPGDPVDTHWFTFADGGRHFHVLVVFGRRASPSIRRQAWRILDSVRIDPRARPDWRSAG